jgi:hypothetical protein
LSARACSCQQLERSASCAAASEPSSESAATRMPQLGCDASSADEPLHLRRGRRPRAQRPGDHAREARRRILAQHLLEGIPHRRRPILVRARERAAQREPERPERVEVLRRQAGEGSSGALAQLAQGERVARRVHGAAHESRPELAQRLPERHRRRLGVGLRGADPSGASSGIAIAMKRGASASTSPTLGSPRAHSALPRPGGLLQYHSLVPALSETMPTPFAVAAPCASVGAE